MASEIRHKGPIVGQTILYTDGSGNLMPALITKVLSGGGLVNLTTFPDQQSPGSATNVPYDFMGVKQPSWTWSDDL